MFTGIIQALGSIVAIEEKGGDKRFFIQSKEFNVGDMVVGDSVCVNGACLSVVSLTELGFSADISLETLNCTTFDSLTVGAKVNLEKALTLSSRLNGHLVSGHVDGIAEVKNRQQSARSEVLTLLAEDKFLRYITAKGSICIDGVSLTINEVDRRCFSVNIIPHTMQETIFDDYREGTLVNMEVDIVARYLESLVKE